MPEAGGTLATYISPYDTDELLTAIRRLSYESKTRKEIESKIKSDYKPQTWQQVFSKLQHIVEDL